MYIKFAYATAAFLLYILVFALIYTFMLRDDFRFSNVETERSFQEEKQEVLALFQSSVFTEDVLSKIESAHHSRFGLEPPSEATVTLELVVREADRLSFSGTVWISKPTQVNDRITVEFATERKLSDCYAFTRPLWSAATNSVVPEEKGVGLGCPWLDDYLGTTLEYQYIDLPDRASEVMFLQFMNAEQELRRGAFWRMVYLSAITATTLGYGDIVPISTRARLVIALQSTLGLILMGVFIAYITRPD